MLISFLKNRYIQLIGCFIIGGIVAVLFANETHFIKREKIIQVVNHDVVRTVVQEKVVVKHDWISSKTDAKIVTYKETFPDGHIIEYTSSESVISQLEQIKAQEKSLYAAKLDDLTRKTTTKDVSIEKTTNPKHLNIYVGFISETAYSAGLNYKLFGPFTFGAQFNKHNGYSVLPTIGITF